LSQHLQKCTEKNPKTFKLLNLRIIKLPRCLHVESQIPEVMKNSTTLSLFRNTSKNFAVSRSYFLHAQ